MPFATLACRLRAASRGSLRLVAATLLLAPAAAAQDPLGLPVVYRVAGMDSVRVEEKIIYKQADEAGLTMSVALPQSTPPAQGWPVIVFVHGGPLGRTVARPATDWGVYRSYVRLAAAHGFVGASFNFRYYDTTRESLARAESDVVDAVTFLQANASRFHLDARRVCLWAFSGGGPMLSAGIRGPLAGIRCLVSYYAALDAGRGNDDYSPAKITVPPGRLLPPTFIGRAGLDSPDINASVELFVMRALRGGSIVTLANHPTGRHGFDILDDEDRSREIIASTFEFVRAQTSAPEPGSETRYGPRVAALRESLLEDDLSAADRLADPAAWAGEDAALLHRVTSEDEVGRLYYFLVQEGKPDQAVRLLEWLVARPGSSVTALDRLADAYVSAGRMDAARSASEKVLRQLDGATGLAPANASALRERARARLKRLSGGTPR